MKASDIADEDIIGIVAFAAPRWVSIWDLEAALPGVPTKVIRAKCKRLIKAKKIGGCWCGCRGDFHYPWSWG